MRRSKMKCSNCNGTLKYYDCVFRLVRCEKRKTRKVKINRYRCSNCGHINRKTPEYLLPYKQYHKQIIIGVITGAITSDTYGYEEYPCDITMMRWKNDTDILSR